MSVGLGRIAIVAAGLLALPCLAHAAGTTGQLPSTALSPLERTSAQRIVVNDSRVRSLIGAGEARVIVGEAEVDKSEAERYLSGESATPPTRHVSILVFNPATNQAARTLVVLGAPQIESVERIDPVNVPFTREDADDALALAKRDAAVRRAIGDAVDRFTLVEPGQDTGKAFVAQLLPVLSSDPHDACHVDRCLDLIFRGERGYLSTRAHIDLSKRSVTVEGGRQ